MTRDYYDGYGGGYNTAINILIDSGNDIIKRAFSRENKIWIEYKN